MGESLLQKVGLLLLTAALTGVLVPVITSQMADASSRRAQSEAASLARQASIIQRQEELLADLETTLFEYHARANAVAWYRCKEINETKWLAAYQAYDAGAWKFTTAMLMDLSRAKRLSSPDSYKKLDAHYQSLLALDAELVRLASTGATTAVWQTTLDRTFAATYSSSDVLALLATDYKLTPTP